MNVYTKQEVSQMLQISRTTLYRYLAKNNIDKNSKITDIELSMLQKSLGKTVTMSTERPRATVVEHVTNNDPSDENINYAKKLAELEFKYNKKIEKKDKIITLLEEKIQILEKDNRELMQNYQNSQVIANETSRDYASLLKEMKLLIAPKEEIEVKQEVVIKDDNKNDDEIKPVTIEDINDKKEKKKKRWWNK